MKYLIKKEEWNERSEERLQRKIKTMGLLDDVPPQMPAGRRHLHAHVDAEFEKNFGALQNLGHEKNSEDFEDSPFADRQPKKET